MPTPYPSNFNSFVGERGLLLSGGQLQRIGLARALYNQSPILILDEATSALDDYTESKIMESIHNIDQKVTIIMVSHRHTTLSKCNRVYQLKNGQVEKVISGKELFLGNN